MIGIRMVYYPPAISPDEPKSIEQILTVTEVARSDCGVVPLVATNLFKVLVANCEELQRELRELT